MKPRVAILMGSDSDLDVMQEALEALKEFGIPAEIHALSAHRTPHDVAQFATNAESAGIEVMICGAGGAAHLAGVVAAHTTLPVIGVPISATSLGGFDALLSTVQMPPGIPVATVAVGKFGARNAGILAVQIMARGDISLRSKLTQFKKDLAEKVREKDRKLQERLAQK